jgi:hypothetical protein
MDSKSEALTYEQIYGPAFAMANMDGKQTLDGCTFRCLTMITIYYVDYRVGTRTSLSAMVAWRHNTEVNEKWYIVAR